MTQEPDDLIALLHALAGDCDNTDGWQDAAPTIRKAADRLEAYKAENAAMCEAVEPILRYHETGGHEGDGSDAALAKARIFIKQSGRVDG